MNPRFGNYRPAFTAFANPFRITLDLSFSINGDLAQKMANTFIRSRRNDPPGRPSADTIYRRLTSDGTSPYSPIANVIALSDSLLLTPDQVSVLRAAQLRHMVAFDSTMRSLAFEMSNLPDPVDLKALAARIRVVRGAAFSAASLYLILRDVLTPLQITLLPADMQRSIRGG